MIFRTLLFFVLMYLLIKIISRFFLTTYSKPEEGNGSGFFYRPNQQQNPNNRTANRSKSRFDQIEEAEFEDITDEEKTTPDSSD